MPGHIRVQAQGTPLWALLQWMAMVDQPVTGWLLHLLLLMPALAWLQLQQLLPAGLLLHGVLTWRLQTQQASLLLMPATQRLALHGPVQQQQPLLRQQQPAQQGVLHQQRRWVMQQCLLHKHVEQLQGWLVMAWGHCHSKTSRSSSISAPCQC